LAGSTEETNWLKGIVANLLKLARMESGRFRLEARPTDL
jgi:K+-sensing histidine kinase KdpD